MSRSPQEDRINQEMKRGIDGGVFPGASLLVFRKQKTLSEQVYGMAQLEPETRKLTQTTLFDISSLTKPVCTASLFIKAVQEGRCSLYDPVNTFYPSLRAAHMSLRHLLNHTSGLPDYRPYYQTLVNEHPDWMMTHRGKDWIIQSILKEPLISKPGEKVLYSDLGYILLGHILEKIYQKRLDQIFDESIAQTFKLNHTFFVRTDKKENHPPIQFAATEICPWRKRVLCGEVMDDNAYAMGGMAGHAGLFSTASDIRKWIDELRLARQGRSRLIKREIFDQFCSIPIKRDINARYFTLGFDTPSHPSSSGKYFSPNSLGHLGYTGCSFWWDLKQDVVIILLTNRVHPSRENKKITEFRPIIHDTVIESLGLSRI